MRDRVRESFGLQPHPYLTRDEYCVVRRVGFNGNNGLNGTRQTNWIMRYFSTAVCIRETYMRNNCGSSKINGSKQSMNGDKYNE